MPVARDNLRRDRLDREAELGRHHRLDARIDIRESPHRARNGAGRDFFARNFQPLPVARHLRIEARELHAERRWLGMDAVRPADRRRHLVFHRALLQRRQHPVHILDQDIARPLQLHREAGVQHVRRRHAEMEETRFVADMLRHRRQERDDVMLHLALDRIDALHIEAAPRPHGDGYVFRDHPQLGHRLGRQRLDLEPDRIALLRLPDRNHLGTGITRNHGASSGRSAEALNLNAPACHPASTPSWFDGRSLRSLLTMRATQPMARSPHGEQARGAVRRTTRAGSQRPINPRPANTPPTARCGSDHRRHPCSAPCAGGRCARQPCASRHRRPSPTPRPATARG